MDFVENRPNRNAISKVYISRSIRRDLRPGDIVVFYRTASGGAAYYTAVTTTIGVVQGVITTIGSEDEFVHLCRKRSVFSDEKLREHWRYNPRRRPFIVNFLYVASFPRRPNRKAMMEAGVMGDAPRGFEIMGGAEFEKLLELANVDQRFIVH